MKFYLSAPLCIIFYYYDDYDNFWKIIINKYNNIALVVSNISIVVVLV